MSPLDPQAARTVLGVSYLWHLPRLLFTQNKQIAPLNAGSSCLRGCVFECKKRDWATFGRR